ncbi:MAG TPA: signal recognition particle-docking protein FtsY [Candidatus Nitrosotenuis sp.]|nr:signal recognition particle-docking protein FtsY [Candidatus Nitrosotenuis sp.]
MFDKLRSAFSNVAKTLSEKELKESDIDDVLFQLEIALLESDVATEVIDSIKEDLKKRLIGTSVDKKQIEEFVRSNLIQTVSSLFDAAGSIDILDRIKAKKGTGEPCVILFVGINGTGKTTTLAKLAHLIKQNKLSVVIAAADTFRAGAIEQLKEHADRLGIKTIAQNYGADPAAVARDAVLYAKSHKIDCVLIDTAGRMQTSKNLMEQIEKITKVVNPDLKIFVGDSLAGNDTVNQAREFYHHTQFDGAILTKSDADARGGAALSIARITSKPVLYVGVGQEYGDLKPFDKNVFLETVFGQGFPTQIQSQQSQKGPTFGESQEIKQEIKPEIKSEQKIEIKPEIKPDVKPEPAPELQIKAKPEIKSEPKTEIKPPQPTTQEKPEPKAESKSEKKSSDPFEGIGDNDISLFAELYDVAPPESDDEASEMAKKIREWIKQGRPKPGQKLEQKEPHDKPQHEEEKEVKGGKEEKRKKGLFGWLKK